MRNYRSILKSNRVKKKGEIEWESEIKGGEGRGAPVFFVSEEIKGVRASAAGQSLARLLVCIFGEMLATRK